MKKLIIFNWKMNPPSLDEAKKLLTNNLQFTTNNKNVEVIVCPPFIYLSALSSVVNRKSLIKLGAQNCFWEKVGAYTGEISPIMLKNLGVEYVIIGHSERRKYLNETDEMINKKVLAALKAGLKVVLCIGENLSIRKRGKKAVENFIKSQLKKNLNSLSKVKGQKSKVVVAYEPIWAISTGHSDTPEDALEMIKYIKQILITHYSILNTKVLYGGSVDSKNIENFLKYKEIDGVLVGSSSVKIKEVKEIINLAINK